MRLGGTRDEALRTTVRLLVGYYEVAQNTVSKFVPPKSPIVLFETKDRKRWNHKHKINFCSTRSCFWFRHIRPFRNRLRFCIRFGIWFQSSVTQLPWVLETFHEVKWNNKERRRVLSVSGQCGCASALSFPSIILLLVQRFLASTHVVINHSFTPIPPRLYFSTDKSVWQVPGSIGVGAHG